MTDEERKMQKELQFLEEQEVSPVLIEQVEAFRKEYPVHEEVRNRISEPKIPFYGKEILEMAMAALLQGSNLLLTGGKATGKNILAENLAWMFGRPSYNISFNVNTDSSSLIGTDTFRNNEVQLRKGSVYRCAEEGGFGVFDEINMAKNDAASVLHATLDYRRMIDVPGYERIELHPATRFIGTMNYGYAGTRELNEALVSRFLVIDMPELSEENLRKIIRHDYPGIKEAAEDAFCGLFLDLQTKAQNSEISTKALDLRGLLGSLGAVEIGLPPYQAVQMGITNKAFDIFEKEIVSDMVMTRIPEDWTKENVF
ncbi:MoxR family ATPase [Clostridiaceae bacterium Marseille-Q4143]|nr:MoxR family ATPase [Clostridiaceae bacterium Marseille-Q4143]